MARAGRVAPIRPSKYLESRQLQTLLLRSLSDWTDMMRYLHRRHESCKHAKEEKVKRTRHVLSFQTESPEPFAFSSW